MSDTLIAYCLSSEVKFYWFFLVIIAYYQDNRVAFKIWSDRDFFKYFKNAFKMNIYED